MKAYKATILMLVFVLIACPSILVGAQDNILYRQDFESSDLELWDLEPGWEIAIDGDNKLLQGEGHNWARLNVGLPDPFRLTLRVRILRGRLHLISNLNRVGRYYYGFSQGRSDANKQYWPDLFEPEVAIGARGHALNQWHEIEIRGEGNKFSMWVNGQLEWEFTDPEPLNPGTFALETVEDALVQVDDIIIYGGESEVGVAPVDEASGSMQWIRTGGPLGGLGYDVRMDPDSPDRMYVTDAFAGVFISEDSGQNWHPSNNGISDRTGESGDAIPVFCLTIDPINPDIVWVGTQYSGGIFKSTDRGETWMRTTRGIKINDGLTFRGITVDPNNSDVIYAAGELSSWVWAGEPINGREFDLTEGIVYKSTDGGESWREIWRGGNLARYIWIDPRDSDVLYVSTGIFDREAANSDPESGIAGGEGVIKSNDGGETWVSANNGLGNLYVGSLFMHPEDPDTLLAGTGNVQYFQDNGVYLSSDGAESWTLVLPGGNIESVEFSTSDPGLAYAGSEGVISRSRDGGKSWEHVSGGDQGWGTQGIRAGFPIDFQVDPRDPERIFANNYGGGNFLSEDGGVTWINASQGYTGAQVRDIVVAPSAPGLVYAAARSGLFVSWDGGSSWSGIAFPPHRELEWNAVAINPENPAQLLAANNWHGGIFFSDNNGRSWDETLRGIAPNHGIRVLKYAPSDTNRVYAGTSFFFSAGLFGAESPALGVYRSDDGGLTWSAANDSISENANITDISISPHNADIVYTATGSGLLKSEDGGASWRYLEEGLPAGREMRSVAINPQNPDLLLAGYWFGGVYRSENEGESWVSTSVGLNPEASVTSIVFDPDAPEIVYLADMMSGVYRSEDGGMTWRLFSNGLRMRTVNQLAFSNDGNHLYAATEGEGVFRLDLSGQAPPAAEFNSAPEDEQGSGPAPSGENSESREVDESTEGSSSPENESESERGGRSPGWCPGSYLPLMFTAGFFLVARTGNSKRGRD